jgi:hypothetical protein
VIVPAWWTPKGRQRAKVRLKAKGKSLGGNDKAKSYFSFDTLVQYQYELAIGDEPVTEQEWHQLVNAKTPLVKFRGQWMELDQDKMQQMLEFWKHQQAENPEMSLMDFIKLTQRGMAKSWRWSAIARMPWPRCWPKLNDKGQLNSRWKIQKLPGPPAGIPEARRFLAALFGAAGPERLSGRRHGPGQNRAGDRPPGAGAGTGPGRADPRIAADSADCPHLRHRQLVPRNPQVCAPYQGGGASRGRSRQDAKAFKALPRPRHRDHLLCPGPQRCQAVQRRQWHRIVLDEAQNIKNPKAAQTKAILKLNAPHRLALTGTPIENRLMDLWSIFNFLNPGYLGTQAQFRRSLSYRSKKTTAPLAIRHPQKAGGTLHSAAGQNGPIHHQRPARQGGAKAVLQPHPRAGFPLRSGD